MRNHIAEGAKYGAYITMADRDIPSNQLQKAEDWLYDQLDATKEAYVAKLSELKILGDPAEQRYKDDMRRPERISELEASLSNYRNSVQKLLVSTNGIEQERLFELQRECDSAEAWLHDSKARQI